MSQRNEERLARSIRAHNDLLRSGAGPESILNAERLIEDCTSAKPKPKPKPRPKY